MLLEALENGGIAIIEHGPAMARCIAGASIMSLLGRRRGRHQDKRSNENNSDHLITPYLLNMRDQSLPRR
jgi:hypothetical protein